MPDRPHKLAHVNFARAFTAFSATPDRLRVLCRKQGYAAAKRLKSLDGKRVLGHAVRQTWGAATLEAMSRKLVWIEQQRFRGFGCSECAWRFNSSGSPTGTSFDEMMRNFELQRDKEFTSHVCADYLNSQDHKP